MYMKKVIRLTETDLMRIVRRVISEQQTPNEFCAVCPEWKDIDNDVYYEGKWTVKGDKILLISKPFLGVGNDSEYIRKPNGFDNWAKGLSSGKFIGNSDHKEMGFKDIIKTITLNAPADTYKICFSK